MAEKKSNALKRYAIWGVPILLLLIIAGFLYLLFAPQEELSDTISIAQEVDLEPAEEPMVDGNLPLESEMGETEIPSEPMEESTETTDSVALTDEAVEPLPPPDVEPETTQTSTMAPTTTVETMTASPTTMPPSSSTADSPPKTPPKKSPIDRVKAALVETDEDPWTIINPRKSDSAPGSWETILVQNHLKFDYTVMSQGPTNWQLAKTDKKLKVQFAHEQSDQKDILSRKKKGKYVVQLISVDPKRIRQALDLVKTLVENGYYSYLHRTEEKFEGKHWFRVRVGTFKTSEEAQLVGQEIYYRYRDYETLPQNYWSVLPSSRELSGELVDLRAQQAKPWFVELPHYGSSEKAFADLPGLSETVDFSYLSRKKEANKVTYRIRVGFYETQSDAKKGLRALRKVKSSYKNSKIVKI